MSILIQDLEGFHLQLSELAFIYQFYTKMSPSFRILLNYDFHIISQSFKSILTWWITKMWGPIYSYFFWGDDNWIIWFVIWDTILVATRAKSELTRLKYKWTRDWKEKDTDETPIVFHNCKKRHLLLCIKYIHIIRTIMQLFIASSHLSDYIVPKLGIE